MLSYEGINTVLVRLWQDKARVNRIRPLVSAWEIQPLQKVIKNAMSADR